MLARSQRLTKSSKILYTYKSGRSSSNEDIFVKTTKNNNTKTLLTIVVPKKVEKSAVGRNRIKRRISELIRKNWQAIKPGYNIVITTKPSIIKKSSQELEKSVMSCLGKLGLI